jgi:hypothetical protein
VTDTERHVLARLAIGPATLAGLRAALPAADLDRKALPTMGESDPFGEAVTALVNDGVVEEQDGLYRAAASC